VINELSVLKAKQYEIPEQAAGLSVVFTVLYICVEQKMIKVEKKESASEFNYSPTKRKKERRKKKGKGKMKGKTKLQSKCSPSLSSFFFCEVSCFPPPLPWALVSVWNALL